MLPVFCIWVQQVPQILVDNQFPDQRLPFATIPHLTFLAFPQYKDYVCWGLGDGITGEF